jgi:RNA recognition motif. (a.k.a. RRM, RBD, or RNP domain)
MVGTPHRLQVIEDPQPRHSAGFERINMSKKIGGGGGGGGLQLPKPRYDYEDHVRRIAEAYAHNHWEDACAAAQALSEHCPMAPLLWLQYARSIQQLLKGEDANDGGSGDDVDADADAGPFVSVLELGLLEFPASSLLHSERVRALLRPKKPRGQANGENMNVAEDDSQQEGEDAFQQALKDAVEAVGRGSHPVDPLVHGLYEMQFQSLVERLAQENRNRGANLEEIQTCLCEWTQYCPTSDVRNEESVAEFFSSKDAIREWFASSVSSEMEESRKLASIHYQQVRSFEDDITIALERQGVGTSANSADWTALDASHAAYGMGLGDAETARVFVRYAKSILKKASTSTQAGYSSSQLALQVLERGIVECPTVELLWMEYVAILQHLIKSAPGTTTNNDDDGDANEDAVAAAALLPPWLARLEAVLTRAIRNCPYSSRLVRARIASYEVLGRRGAAVVDPDALLNHVKDAVQSGFLLRPHAPAAAGEHDDPITTDQSVSQIVVDLFHSVLHVIKQRILSLLALANPKATSALRALENGTSKKPPAISSIVQQQLQQRSTNLDVPEEVADLLEDLGDLYEEMDKAAMELLGQSQATGAVRSWLWRDGSHTQQLLLSPVMLQQRAQDEAEPPSHSPESATDAVKALKWMEQAIKLHNPPHPDLFLEYVHELGLMPSINVLQRIRLLRFTFAKGVRGVGRSKTHSHRYTNYDSSLRQLCHEWLEFEACWGSADSLSSAQQAVHKKLSAAAAAAAAHAEEPDQTRFASGTTSGKRPYPTPGEDATSSHDTPTAAESTDSQGPDSKRSKPNSIAADSTADLTIVAAPTSEPIATDSTNHEPAPSNSHDATMETASSPKTKVVHKVRVGKLDFPAHPYTVKVSNLSPDTADMDLVDAFRRCGSVVHARIVRDKSHPVHNQGGGHWRHGAPAVPPSKGYGLVQFEERESVEAALALHDVIGLSERVLHVERSHTPAALIVPPGMHRVSEKGQGKYSKRNERRKDLVSAHKGGSAEGQQMTEPGDASQGAEAAPTDNPNGGAPAKPAGASVSVLSFRPRGVGRGGHQKTRIALPKDKPK